MFCSFFFFVGVRRARLGSFFSRVFCKGRIGGFVRLGVM